jgi:peptidyl-dipeptidase A
MEIYNLPLKNVEFKSSKNVKKDVCDKNHSNDFKAPTSENYRAYFGSQNCDKISKKGAVMSKNDLKFIKLRDDFCEKVEPKELKANIDCWNFYINSTPENMEIYQKSQDEVSNLFKDEKLYKQFKELEDVGLKDRHLNKQLKNLNRDFDEELNSGELKKALRDKENEIASKFNSYVPKIDGKETTKAELNKLLQNEKDVTLRKKAYDAKVLAGDLIADNLVELVKMRNEFAKTKGYKNFFEYNLKEVYDVDSKELQDLLDNVYTEAKPLNKKLEKESKEELSKEYGISPNELKAYHYGLLLDSNPQKEVNKSLKTKEQVVDIAKRTYKNMGYDIDSMPIVLDLFPRKNKNTHGFCFDIQAGKDARILANLTNDSSSLDTACHEMGHCVYHIGISTDIPYVDRNAYPAVTEAVAMMMGDLQQKEDILKGIVPDDTLSKFKADHKKSEAKFINKSMLIINFEKSMYENPNQDLGKLWHDLRCKYTGANESDEINNEWATIPHYLSHPAYYQNYFRADLMKAQMYNHLTKKLGALTENKETAKYLNENLFRYGMSVDEGELIKQFTGESLSGKALCDNLK